MVEGSNPLPIDHVVEGDVHLLPREYLERHHLVESTEEKRVECWAIYARYSSVSQFETSIERQIEICTAAGRSHGAVAFKIFADRELSGMANERPELKRMMAEIRDFLITHVMVEVPDRLARKEVIAHSIYDTMAEHGVRLFSSQTGELDPLSYALAALMGAEFRRNLLRLSRAGKLSGARAGRFMGRAVFGTKAGPGGRGFRVLHEERAEIVREIFVRYHAGEHLNSIAKAISGQCLTPMSCVYADQKANGRYKVKARKRPRTLTMVWTSNMVRGILLNTAFMGVYQYNQFEVRTDPDTKVTVRRQRPVSDWVVVPVDQVRLVDKKVWRDNFIRLRANRLGPRGPARSIVHLLSGKAHCGVCGEMLYFTRDSDRGVFCGSTRAVCEGVGVLPEFEIERLVVELVVGSVVTDAAVARFRILHAEAEAAAEAGEAARRVAAQTELEAFRLMSRRLLDNYLMQQFEKADVEKRTADINRSIFELELEIASLDPARDRSLRALDTLLEAVSCLAGRVPLRPDSPDDSLVFHHIRSLIPRVDVFPADAQGMVRVSVEADLQALGNTPLGDGALPVRRADMHFNRREATARLRGRTLAASIASEMAAAEAYVREFPSAAVGVLETLFSACEDPAGSVAEMVLTFQGMLFVATRGLTMPRVPALFSPDAATFRSCARALVARRLYDRARAAVLEVAPALFEDVDLSRYETANWHRRVERDPSAVLPTARELMARLESEPDPVVKRRIRAIAMRLDGVDQETTSRTVGLSVTRIAHLWSVFREKGAVAFVHKVRRTAKPARLNDRQAAEVCAVWHAGVNPQDPRRRITVAALRHHIEARYAVRMSTSALGALLLRHGIRPEADRRSALLAKIGGMADGT
ncbi:MAG: recombinase family protein [Xanthobacteraceae bacterium]|nr:recombinase family protein [Xanthobacteraceae bacterium]